MKMNPSLSFCFLVIFTVLVLSPCLVASKKAVLKLTKDNFDQTLKENEHVLVKFYAPWCGHCKSMAPKYEEAAAQLAEQGSKVVLAELDATKEEELAGRFKIEGFPTLKLFRNGLEEDYNGGRDTKDFVEFCEKVNLPPAATLNDETEVKAFIEENGVSAVLFLHDTESSSSATKRTAFDRVARQTNNEYPFGIVENKNIMKKYAKDLKVKSLETFMLLSTSFGSTTYTLVKESEFKLEKLSLFLNVYTLALVPTWNEQTAPSIFKSGEYFFFGFRNSDKESEEYENMLKLLEPIAAKHRAKIAAGDVNGVRFVDVTVKNNKEGVELADFFEIDVETSKFPIYRGVRMTEDGAIEKYLPPENVNDPSGIELFIDDFVAGNVKPMLKSEPAPTDNDEKNLKVIVGETFNEMVEEKGKDVLVKFYAPWCGHCKAMAPSYEKLANIFEDIDHVVIAKIDGTANDVHYDGVDVQGFPTLYLFSDSADGERQVKLYDGERSLKGMLEFLGKKAQPYKLSEKAQTIIKSHIDTNDLPSDEEEDDQVVDETNVVALTAETFASTIKENEFVMVEFYAPWCGHCKALKPDYAAAADEIKDFNPNVILAKLDATKYQEVATKNNVEGFPTLKFFKNGTASVFNGGRDVRSIVSFVKSNLRPTLTIIDNMGAMDEFLSSAEGTNILFSSFGNDPQSEMVASYFKKSAPQDQFVAYAIIPRENNQEVIDYVANSYNIKMQSSQVSHVFFVKVNKETNENEVFEMDLSECKNEVSFASFTSIVRLPTVTIWNENQAEALFSGLQEDFLFGFVKSLDGSQLHDEMKDICPKLRSFGMKKKFACVIVETNDQNRDMMEFFQITDDTVLPTYRGVHLGTSDTEEVNVYQADEGNDIIQYVKDITDGKIEKMEHPERQGSEASNEEEEEDPNTNVVTLTTENWEAEVMKSENDVLVEFYAPWCGHCQALKPIYEQVANEYASDEQITVAKINADKHEIPGIDIEGFPTIKFFKHGKKDTPIEYEGMGRSANDFINFVNAQYLDDLSEKTEL